MMKKRLLAMLLVLSMVVTLLPATALAAEGTPAEGGTIDCYIEGSDGSYSGYNWMGGNPAVGDKDVYVYIVGNVPDGWTMVGGKWTGAGYIDTDSNRLLDKADYWNTVIERDGMFKSVVRLSPPLGSEKESVYPNEKLKLQFVSADERLVLDNGGIVTVNTDERSTAVAELTAAYKGYLRINEPTESNTIYMLVFDKAKYDVNREDAYVGVVYGNGLVTTEELHLDPGEYKVFVFKGSSLATSVSTLSDVNLLKQFLKDGILHDENCTQMDVVVEPGRITPLKNALPPKALTGDALCSIRFVTEQTETGDLRVKFYMDKLPAGKWVRGMRVAQRVAPINPAAPDTTLSDISCVDKKEALG